MEVIMKEITINKNTEEIEKELITFMQNEWGFQLIERNEKLLEEFQELMETLGMKINYSNIHFTPIFNHKIDKDKVIDELGDCIALMLHVAHYLSTDSTEVLSRTLHKLKQRKNNNYYKTNE
jgi:NTP pyrophosphatase (non-canonical NTP hydrolase)